MSRKGDKASEDATQRASVLASIETSTALLARIDALSFGGGMAKPKGRVKEKEAAHERAVAAFAKVDGEPLLRVVDPRVPRAVRGEGPVGEEGGQRGAQPLAVHRAVEGLARARAEAVSLGIAMARCGSSRPQATLPQTPARAPLAVQYRQEDPLERRCAESKCAAGALSSPTARQGTA